MLLTERDFYDLTAAYLAGRPPTGVRHAEIFFDPQTHTRAGSRFDVVWPGSPRALAEAERGARHLRG